MSDFPHFGFIRADELFAIDELGNRFPHFSKRTAIRFLDSLGARYVLGPNKTRYYTGRDLITAFERSSRPPEDEDLPGDDNEPESDEE